MKKSIVSFAFLFALLFAVSLGTMNCSSKKSDQTEEEHHHHEGDSTDHHDMKMDLTQMAYACSMHPEVTGKEGDMCTQCGMKLEALKEGEGEHKH